MTATAPNPERLILARESRGESQLALAEQANIAQYRLSRLESGLAVARPEEVESIAKALHYPSDFFYRDGGLVSPGTDSFHHRQKQSLTVGDRKRIHAALRLRRLELAEMLRDVEIDASQGFQALELDDFDGDLERVADAVRGNWGLPPGPILDLTGVIERCGGIVYHYQFGTNKLDAVSQLCAPLPALFFVNSDVPADRARWNLAHELGHLLLHHGINPNAEHEANGFAAAFLMPREDIIRDLAPPLEISKLLELKAKWRVAVSALIMRARELGTISESQAKSQFMRMGRRGWRTREPGRFPLERPRLLDTIVALQRTEHRYSVDELSRRVGLHANEFLRLYLRGDPQVRSMR